MTDELFLKQKYDNLSNKDPLIVPFSPSGAN